MLTPINDALADILSQAPLLSSADNCPIDDIVGRVVATDIVCPMDVPPWPNSAMDGYAVRVQDVEIGRRYAVTQKVFAGMAPQDIQHGSVARIFTGAPTPSNCDAVIMQEDAQVEGDYVSFTELPRIQQHIRPQAQDMTAGQLLFATGHVFKAADIAVLCSTGLSTVLVKSKPRVVVFSSGDELVPVGQPLKQGQIYNSNSQMLQAMLTQLGCEVRLQHTVADTLEATKTALLSAASNTDLVVSTGGVSVGEADYMRAALSEVGQVNLWKLAIKPGKPLVFGEVNGIPYFGLPGNPSSAFVTCLITVLPFIDHMLQRKATLDSQYAIADFDWSQKGSRQEYLRVRLYRDGYQQRVKMYDNQSSGNVHSTSWANALAIIPIGAEFKRGAVVEVLPLPV